MITKILHDGIEGHKRRSLERAAKMDRGERLEPERIFTFADGDDMLECLTAQRLRLCQVVRRKRLSITALAEELDRNRGSVTRDVNKLKSYGLLRLREEVNPGHGWCRSWSRRRRGARCGLRFRRLALGQWNPANTHLKSEMWGTQIVG